MPKLDLTMDQWGTILKAVRAELKLCIVEKNDEDVEELSIIEDRIIDMAFKLARETEEASTAKKDNRSKYPEPAPH